MATRKSAVDRFNELAAEPRFRDGWPLVSDQVVGQTIQFFGKTLNYRLRTGNGEEEYTSILRTLGWAVCFGVDTDGNVATLCQWKPGVNRASWELPPGGIGNIAPEATLAEITLRTQTVYLNETGLGGGSFELLGHVMIETGKYRGAGPGSHGLPAYLFLATDLKHIQGARRPNPNEIIETIPVPLVEFPSVLASGLFVETSAVACAYMALIKLGLLNWAGPKS